MEILEFHLKIVCVCCVFVMFPLTSKLKFCGNKSMKFMKILNYVLCSRNTFNLELRLPPKPATTTLTPYVYTTVKPRRKQHQSHNNKAGHDTYRVKETLIPSIILENEIVGSVEGKTTKNVFVYYSIHHIVPYTNRYLYYYPSILFILWTHSKGGKPYFLFTHIFAFISRLLKTP